MRKILFIYLNFALVVNNYFSFIFGVRTWLNKFALSVKYFKIFYLFGCYKYPC